MPVTASPRLVSTHLQLFPVILSTTPLSDFILTEVFTITSQECKPASVSLTTIFLSGQVRIRKKDSMKIPNLVRSKLCAQMMFSQDDKVERWKDVEILNRFPIFGSHSTDVESETVERSSRGGGGRRLGFLFFVTINFARCWNRLFTRGRCGWR